MHVASFGEQEASSGKRIDGSGMQGQRHEAWIQAWLGYGLFSFFVFYLISTGRHLIHLGK